jgi:hypothetical protein
VLSWQLHVVPPSLQQTDFAAGSQQTSCTSTAQHAEVARPPCSLPCARATRGFSDIVILFIVVSSMRRIARRYL